MKKGVTTCCPGVQHYAFGLCRSCYDKERMKLRDKERARIYQQVYRATNPLKVSATRSKRNKEKYTEGWKKSYQKNLEKRIAFDNEAIWEPERIGKRPGRCLTCSKECKPYFDHCHKTKRFRGWICQQCNTAIGHAKDNPALLRTLAEYLENFHKETGDTLEIK